MTLLICVSLLGSACAQSASNPTPSAVIGATLKPVPRIVVSAAPSLTPQASFTPARTPTADRPKRTPTRSPATQTTSSSQADWVDYPAEKIQAPILLYHRIEEDGDGRYVLPLQTFQRQIQYLSEHGYQTILISQLVEVIRGGGQLPPKPIVLTFDDGYMDTYDNAFPVLQKAGYTGVAYIITATLDSKISYGYMQADELKTLHQAGWEIGSHSISHTDVKSSKLGLRNEIEKSRTELEDLLGFSVRSFSYPFGLSNTWIESQMEQYGYDSAVGLGTLNTHSEKSLYYLSRREVENGMDLNEFADLLKVDDDNAQ